MHNTHGKIIIHVYYFFSITIYIRFKMKNSSDLSSGLLITIIFLAIVVIFTTFMAARKVVPYNAGSKYENMGVEGFSDQNLRPQHYATYPGGQSTDVKDQYLIKSTAADTTAQRVPGLSGVFGPGETTNKMLDIYSTAQGSLADKCASTSSEMSNSMGYLCLNQDQLKLLTTRGGNQTCTTCAK